MRNHAEIAGGHEMIVTHDCDGAVYTSVCRERDGAVCRLICGEGCEDWPAVTRDGGDAFHGVYGHDGSLIGRHRMIDTGECQAVLWFEQDPGVTPELAEDGTDLFEIGRFPICPVWADGGVKWQRVTALEDLEAPAEVVLRPGADLREADLRGAIREETSAKQYTPQFLANVFAAARERAADRATTTGATE